MGKSKALHISGTERAALRPARAADAELDHLERMIRSMARSADRKAFACLDRAYWRRRLATLGDESDLVSTQRARVLQLLELLAQNHADATSKKAAA